jgi:putative acetyltransferase
MSRVSKEKAHSSIKNILHPVSIRAERPADYEAVDGVVKAAFKNEGENVATLVNDTRQSDNYIPELSLIAENETGIVGHVMLSYVELDDDGTRHKVLTLSPLSVSPLVQGQGIGSQLVKAAIEVAEKRAEPLIVLEGSPDYYPRFGYRYSVPLGITIDLPSWARKEAAMVLPLSNYDPAIKGHVVYPAAFKAVEER